MKDLELLGNQFQERISKLYAELNTLLEPLGCGVRIVPIRGAAKKERKIKSESKKNGLKTYWNAIREICEKDGLTKAEAIATYKRRKLENVVRL